MNKYNIDQEVWYLVELEKLSIGSFVIGSIEKTHETILYKERYACSGFNEARLFESLEACKEGVKKMIDAQTWKTVLVIN